MPTLHWIGKEAVVKHHKDVPYRLLERVPELDCGVSDSGNLIVQGDNLHALKALLPRFAGQVKCIYIDPPYNTGNEGWVYNDNVNSPEIRKWFEEHKVVGKEGETLDRHDRWLCMMYPRLLLLKRFLTDDGVIFVSIDDNEVAYLRLLMDEIFESRNFVSDIVWQRSKKGDAKLIANIHEYIVVYVKNKDFLLDAGKMWRKKKEGVDKVLACYAQLKKLHDNNHEVISKEIAKWFNSLDKNDSRKAHKHYRYSDDRGLYFAADFAGPNDGRNSRPRYDIFHPVTGNSCKKPSTGWRWEEKRTQEALEANPPLIHFGVDETTIPCRKSYLEKVDEEPFTSVFYKDGRGASLQVDTLLWKKAFDFPKNVDVIEDLIRLTTDEDSIILDTFAGSGTTAHAVLNLNKQDGGNRQFILVEMDETIATTVTAERNKRVIEGYENAKGEAVEGLGGGFQFYRLSKEPLFTAPLRQTSCRLKF